MFDFRQNSLFVKILLYLNSMYEASDTRFARKHALEIRYIVVVPSWPGKYNNCHLLLNSSPTKSDKFSRTKVQDVVTNSTAVTLCSSYSYIRFCSDNC